MNCSFFPDAVATTLAPLAFAIWIAKAPVAELPPFIKTLCSGSTLAIWWIAWYEVRAAIVIPAASIGVMLDGLFTTQLDGTRMYWDKAPCRVLDRIALGTHP